MKNILFLLLVTASSCFSQTINRIDLTDSTWISVQRPTMNTLTYYPNWSGMFHVVSPNIYSVVKEDTIQIEISFTELFQRVIIDFNQELPKDFFNDCKGLDTLFWQKKYSVAYEHGKLFTEQQIRKNIIDYLNKQGYIVTSK